MLGDVEAAIGGEAFEDDFLEGALGGGISSLICDGIMQCVVAIAHTS